MRNYFNRFLLLLRSVPPLLLTVFVMSVFSMNLLANKSINLSCEYLALDCGIIISWFAFLAMDMITRRFGPAAATQISVLALVLNLFFCLIFALGSCIPGQWGEAYVVGSEALLNSALDSTFGGTWYVLLGSALAFLASSIVNNFTNYGVGRLFGSAFDSRRAYYIRSLVSTALGQFTDNIVFALCVSHVFFGWTLIQCVTCALTGMLVELLCELIFSPLGFRISERWKRDGIGAEYLAAYNAFKNGGQA